MNIIEKKKKKPYSSKTTTTGDIQKNIDHFNKMLTGKAENNHIDGYLNGTFKSQSPDGASSISTGGEASGGDCGGGMGESLNINEAKRVVRRYLIRPQNIFCGSKFDIIKALIDIGNENCSVYTLNNLDDNNDTTKLTNKDIIYYYDDGVLYDKNKVKVMDYDLYVKREEKRDKIDVNKVSDATLDKVYKDRLTDQTELEEELSVGDKVICKVDNNRKGTIMKKVPNKDLYEVEFESTDSYPARHDTYYAKDLELDNELNLDFDDVNIFGESLREGREVNGTCCICGEDIIGYGNNPEPYMSAENGERCCDGCNLKFVIPARLEAMNRNED